MHPIYFPFTYVSETTARALEACFLKTRVYRAMDYQGETIHPAVDIQIPASGDENKIKKILTEYKAWAKLHQGDALAFMQSRKTEIPFYSETSISNIRRDIKKRITDPAGISLQQPPLPGEELFAARLFLAIAHEHDIYQTQVREDLDAVKEMEKKLFDDLRGGEEDRELSSLYSGAMGEGPEEILMDHRIHAWVQLALLGSDSGAVWVTTHPAVPEALIERGLIAADPIAKIERTPVSEAENPDMTGWKQALMEKLEQCASGALPSTDPGLPAVPEGLPAKTRITLSVYIAPNTRPGVFIKNLASAGDMAGAGTKDNDFVHTLVCLISA